MEGLPIMRKQPPGFVGQYAEHDYFYLGSEQTEDGYRQSAAPVKFRYPSLGRFVDSYSIPESGIGTVEIIGQGYFAVVWAERHGPYTTRQHAEMELGRMLNRRKDYKPVMDREPIAALLIIWAVIGFIAWLIYEAVQLWG